MGKSSVQRGGGREGGRREGGRRGGGGARGGGGCTAARSATHVQRVLGVFNDAATEAATAEAAVLARLNAALRETDVARRQAVDARSVTHVRRSLGGGDVAAVARLDADAVAGLQAAAEAANHELTPTRRDAAAAFLVAAAEAARRKADFVRRTEGDAAEAIAARYEDFAVLLVSAAAVACREPAPVRVDAVTATRLEAATAARLEAAAAACIRRAAADATDHSRRQRAKHLRNRRFGELANPFDRRGCIDAVVVLLWWVVENARAINVVVPYSDIADFLRFVASIFAHSPDVTYAEYRRNVCLDGAVAFEHGAVDETLIGRVVYAIAFHDCPGRELLRLCGLLHCPPCNLFPEGGKKKKEAMQLRAQQDGVFALRPLINAVKLRFKDTRRVITGYRSDVEVAYWDSMLDMFCVPHAVVPRKLNSDFVPNAAAVVAVMPVGDYAKYDPLVCEILWDDIFNESDSDFYGTHFRRALAPELRCTLGALVAPPTVLGAEHDYVSSAFVATATSGITSCASSSSSLYSSSCSSGDVDDGTTRRSCATQPSNMGSWPPCSGDHGAASPLPFRLPTMAPEHVAPVVQQQRVVHMPAVQQPAVQQPVVQQPPELPADDQDDWYHDQGYFVRVTPGLAPPPTVTYQVRHRSVSHVPLNYHAVGVGGVVAGAIAAVGNVTVQDSSRLAQSPPPARFTSSHVPTTFATGSQLASVPHQHVMQQHVVQQPADDQDAWDHGPAYIAQFDVRVASPQPLDFHAVGAGADVGAVVDFSTGVDVNAGVHVNSDAHADVGADASVPFLLDVGAPIAMQGSPRVADDDAHGFTLSRDVANANHRPLSLLPLNLLDPDDVDELNAFGIAGVDNSPLSPLVLFDPPFDFRPPAYHNVP